MQIICICPDICVSSVLNNRHCADICTICQKCQFGVRKGWQVLLFQSKAEDMYCNQADSAILKLSFVQASMEQIYCITKQTYVVITIFCRGMGYVPFTRILSPTRAFWVCFVQTFTQTFVIWLRFCADIWTKNRRLAALHAFSFTNHIFTESLSSYHHMEYSEYVSMFNNLILHKKLLWWRPQGAWLSWYSQLVLVDLTNSQPLRI